MEITLDILTEYDATTFHISRAIYAGIYDIWEQLSSEETEEIFRLYADGIYFDEIWEHRRLRGIKERASKVIIYRNFTEWGSNQTWSEYVLSKTPYLPPTINNTQVQTYLVGYIYSILILSPNGTHVIAFFNNFDYLQGVITGMNWFDIDVGIIKYIVRNNDSQLMRIL